MSSHQSSNEKLSSYFDHEVSPEERKELESLLETSAEARQDLHEIGEISRLLQETATELAPPELAPSIRRRIEQETLLAKPSQPVTKHAPSTIRYRIAVAISACSSMVALVLFVLLMNSYKSLNQFNSDRNLGFAHSESSSAKMEAPAGTSEFAMRNNSPNSGSWDFDHKNEKVAALPAPQSSLFKGIKDDTIGKPSSGRPLSMKESTSLSAPTAGKKSAKFSVLNSYSEEADLARDRSSVLADGKVPAGGIPSDIPLDTIQIGDVLPYFRDINDKVAVIEVRVVDVQQALGTMELLLARNNIPVNQQKQSEVERQLQTPNRRQNKPQAEGNSSALKSKDDDTQLFAVYVEATDEQLAAALKDFEKDLKRDQFVSLALQPAINTTSLTKKVKELPQLLARRSDQADGLSGRLEDRNRAKKTLFHRQNQILQENVSSEMKKLKANKSVTASSKMDQIADKQKSGSSFQARYRMQLPAQQLGRSQAMKRTTDNFETVRKKASTTNLPLVASKPALGMKAQKGRALSTSAQLSETSPPIKVLFVFKNSAPAPTSSPPK